MTILRTFRLHCLTFDRANILVLSMLHHEFLEQIRPTVNLKVESDETELPKWVHWWMKDHVTCRTPINSTFLHQTQLLLFFDSDFTGGCSCKMSILSGNGPKSRRCRA